MKILIDISESRSSLLNYSFWWEKLLFRRQLRKIADAILRGYCAGGVFNSGNSTVSMHWKILSPTEESALAEFAANPTPEVARAHTTGTLFQAQ